MKSKPTHIVLIGASIGQGWNLSGWPARTGCRNFTAEALAVWKFDKTEAVEEVLMRPRRPFRFGRSYFKGFFQPAPASADIVVLKECSAYFPGNLAEYRDKVQHWVAQLQARNKPVVLATVVPITRTRAAQDAGKQDALLAYNRWVRDYATDRGVPVLDLEAALRSDVPGSYLDERFAQPDGSHLNQTAYAVLDHCLRDLLIGAPGADATAVQPQTSVWR